MKKILEVKNINKKYQSKEGEILALKDVSFDVNDGEFISIIGPSGCGKSTLLSIIAGLESKSSGSISLNGKEMEGCSPSIGYMLQRDCLLEWRSILSNAMFGLEIKGKTSNSDKEYVEKLLKKYSLYEFKDKIFHVHYKDIRVYPDKLNDVGIMAYPLDYMSPKLPGLGDVDWGKYVSALTDIGYNGYTCLEIEDRAFESSLDDVKKSIILSKRYMSQFVI